MSFVDKFPWFDPNEGQVSKPKRTYSKPFKLRLIHEVKKRPYLWDPSDEQFGNNSLNRKAWMDICNLMNRDFQNDDPMHPQLARKNFKNLRDMYKTRWLEVKTGKRSAQKWDYFSSMNFLAEVFEKNDDALDVTAFLNENLLNETEDDQLGNEELNLESLLYKRPDDKDDVTILDYSSDGQEMESIRQFNERIQSHPSPSISAEPPMAKKGRFDRIDPVDKPTMLKQGISLAHKKSLNEAFVQGQESGSPLPSNLQLPPVISFILDKYHHFLKKSPQLAGDFENELLKVVINFNARPS